MDPQVPLSIVVPAYNEERRLGRTLENLLAFFARETPPGEILVVDDGSRDGTADLARRILGTGERHQVLRHEPNRGKGFAVRRGILASRGEFVLFTDADLSTPIREAVRLLAAIRDGHAVAIGSRALKGSRVVVHQPRYREWLGRMFNLVVQAVTLPGIWDTQCGFKCFTREAAIQVFSRQRIDGFGFDVEALYIARRLGYRIAEVPVEWHNSPDSRVRPGADGLRMVRQIFEARRVHGRLTPRDRERALSPAAAHSAGLASPPAEGLPGA